MGDENTLQAQVQYEVDSGWQDPALSEADGDTTATNDDATVENDLTYQVGNHTTAASIEFITTNAGANTLTFIWESQTDEPAADTTTAQIQITPFDG